MLLALVVSVMSAVKAEAEHCSVTQHEPDPEVESLLSHFPMPGTNLTPDQVVKIQLSAFKVNDAADQGVRKAYEFSSPASRLLAGPMERFSLLVRNPVYAPLLNFESVSFGPVQVIGDEAEQRVAIVASSGAEARYCFRLSRQCEGAFAGCWMTDRLEPV
jgi:hypothetical protein